MPYDEGLAQIFRTDLARHSGITEKKMFGGLCFFLNGNMLCGVSNDGGMARVGKELESQALQEDGVTPLAFTGRKMGGLVDLSQDAMADDPIRKSVLKLALQFVGALPPK